MNSLSSSKCKLVQHRDSQCRPFPLFLSVINYASKITVKNEKCWHESVNWKGTCTLQHMGRFNNIKSKNTAKNLKIIAEETYVIFLRERYFYNSFNLRKCCQESTESSHKPRAGFLLLLTSYIIRIHILPLMKHVDILLVTKAHTVLILL